MWLSQLSGGAIHDTIPLSSFLVLRIFIALPWGRLYSLFCLLCSTPQFLLPLLLRLCRPPLVSPSPLLPASRFSTSSNFFPTFPNIDNHTPRLTIQIIFWQCTVLVILLSSNLHLLLFLLVISPSCCPFHILLQIPLALLLHSADFLCSPKCHLLR